MVGAVEQQPIDFFISRAGADAAFADEIGRILEDAGNRVELQQWDFANRNFMERMHTALESGARVIALLSSEYLASHHCAAEWLNTIANDPLNKRARLIVMRVSECVPTGLLTALAYWDLVRIRGDNALLRDVVLAAVRPGRHKGEATPGAPYWRAARAVAHRDIKATPSFTGREAELADLDAALWSGGMAAVTQPAAVHGLGGVGKSVLAREYAFRNKERYAGVWWLDAATPEGATEPEGGEGFDGIETGLVNLGAVFIPGLDQAEDRAAAARKTLDLIADESFEKPWLLVYDNVDDARALKHWAPVGNAQVLATARLGGWSNSVGTIEIREWPLPDAIRYLRHESGRDDLSDDDARSIAETLGCLPLALSHAAAYLRARINITAEKYLTALARHMREAPKDADTPRAVFATLQQNADQAETEAAGARAVLWLAAFYAPDAIPEELFRQPANCYPPTLAELLADACALDDAIGALAHLSLIDFDLDRRVFSIHRLTQAAARDAVGVEAGTWAESALRAMYGAFPMPESQTWPQCERLATHARAVASHVETDSYELGVVLGRAGTYLEERAALADVVPLYERCSQVFQRLAAAYPTNAWWQRELAVSHNNVGGVLLKQGKGDGALHEYRSSLYIRKRLLAAEPSNTGWQRDLSMSHNNVGDVLLAQGKGAEALDAYRASLKIAEDLATAAPSNAD